MQVEHFCEGRRCTAYHNREPVHLVVATEVESGYSVRLHIEPSREQLPHAPQEQRSHFDDLSLMKSSPAISQTTGLKLHLAGKMKQHQPMSSRGLLITEMDRKDVLLAGLSDCIRIILTGRHSLKEPGTTYLLKVCPMNFTLCSRIRLDWNTIPLDMSS